MYFNCWPETMFWRQRKMNFENIFILPNVIGDRSRRRFGGIFIKIPKVTSAWSSLMHASTKGDWRVEERTTLNKRMNCCLEPFDELCLFL